jgi:cytochrome c553
MKLSNLVIAAAIAATPMLAQAGDAAAGKAKSVMCTSCHGANGKAAIPTYPNLAGQNAAYLEMALKDYKNGKRNGAQSAIMAGMAKPLTDADIANLAAYYSSL